MREYYPEEHILSHYPLLRILLPFLLGIALADAGYDGLRGSSGWLLAGAAGMGLFAWLLYKCKGGEGGLQRPVGWMVWALMAALFLTGAARLVAVRDATNRPLPTGRQTFHAVVEEPARRTEKTFSVTVIAQDGALSGRKLRLALMRTERDGEPKPGEVLLCQCEPSPPRDAGNPRERGFADYLQRQGVAATGLCFTGQWQSLHRQTATPTLRIRALELREALLAQYERQLEGKELAIVSALTLGDKSQLDAGTRSAFSDSGVSHVLALSGLHLGILFGIFNFLILRPLRDRRLLHAVLSLVGIAGLWLFAFLAGLPLSLVRAAVMFSIMLAASLVRHERSAPAHLIIAALVILLVSPEALFDIGFQLSFIAVAGIVLFHSHLPVPRAIRSRRVPRWLYDLALVSLCAQVSTAPLVAYYFHNLPLYGLVANFVAVPMAYLVLFLAVLFFLLPPLQGALATAMSHVVSLSDVALTGISRWPGASLFVQPDTLTVFCLYAILGALLVLIVRRRALPVYIIAGSLLMICAIEVHAAHGRHVAPQVVFYNLRSTPAVHFIASRERSFLWVPRGEEAQRAIRPIRNGFWRECSVAEPLWCDSTRVSERDFVLNGHIALFGGKRFAMLMRRLPREPEGRITVECLLIAKGYNQPLAHALRFFAPRRVVLGASLSDFYRRRYRTEAWQAGLPCHDIQSEGALILPLAP